MKFGEYSSSKNKTTIMAEKKPSPIKLLLGTIGIFGAFTYYGYLMGPIVKYKNSDGEKFGQFSFFLSALEASANVLVGTVGLLLTQGTPSPGLPAKSFLLTGTSQVLSKTMFTMAQNFGLPFFLATLVKNAKMLPVMVGGMVTANEKYAARKWFQVALIIGGCVLVTVGKNSSKPKEAAAAASADAGDSSAEMLGFLCLAVSLTGDGFTGGKQKAMNKAYEKNNGGKKLKPYDLMTFTNLAMMLVAVAVSLAKSEFFDGLDFLLANPDLLPMVVKFSFCSAIGQSAIFFTMANFDPLMVTMVTTTRKIFSVLLGIVQDGKVLAPLQWAGVAVATLGVIGEVQEKFGGGGGGKGSAGKKA